MTEVTIVVEKHGNKQTGSHARKHTNEYIECLTFEGQEDPGSRERLAGGGEESRG